MGSNRMMCKPDTISKMSGGFGRLGAAALDPDDDRCRSWNHHLRMQDVVSLAAADVDAEGLEGSSSQPHGNLFRIHRSVLLDAWDTRLAPRLSIPPEPNSNYIVFESQV